MMKKMTIMKTDNVLNNGLNSEYDILLIIDEETIKEYNKYYLNKYKNKQYTLAFNTVQSQKSIN